jgi:hypothetical protein
MTSSRRLLWFCFCLAVCLGLLERYARARVKTTPARQAFARYAPDGRAHAVFLGSSLTDAGILPGLLDSLQAENGQGFRTFNLALAGISGSANYFLIFRKYILPRGKPRYLIVEAPGIPFLPPEAPFRADGLGLRVESFRTELMDFGDLCYLSGGFPGFEAVAAFALDKAWRTYHYRQELQARIRERLWAWGDSSGREDGTHGSNGTGPYRMAGDARERFAREARSDLDRLERRSGPGGLELLHRREAHLLDLAEAARSAGVRLVILRPPCPPMDGVTQEVPSFLAYNRGFRTLCDSLGVAYFDMGAGGMACDGLTFSDGIHLDGPGARAFTGCVSRALALILVDEIFSATRLGNSSGFGPGTPGNSYGPVCGKTRSAHADRPSFPPRPWSREYPLP